MKRLFDLLFSILFLCFASPIFLLCALAVRLSSTGPVFYAHLRVGKEGRAFYCLKFRTMYRDAAARLEPLLASDPSLMQEWNTYFKLKEDPRITVVGRFLRKSSLDELPQVWNVLKGDMSVVGPRPLTQHEVAYYLKEKAQKILSVRPGLTSIWITQGRNALTLDQRVQLEELYIDRASFWLDIKLIVLTAWRMFFSKGAY